MALCQLEMACYQNPLGIFPNFFSLTKLTVGVEVERRRQDGEGEISLWFLPAWIAENDEALTTTAPLRLKLTISLTARDESSSHPGRK